MASRLAYLFAAAVFAWQCLPSLVAGQTPQIDVSKLPPSAEKKIDFAQDIQPLFKKNCFSCHGAEVQEGGLRLDLKKRALDGGDHAK